MKTILIFILLVFTLSSCGDYTPMLNSKNPFVVHSIVNIGHGFSEYYGNVDASYDNFLGGRPTIVLPTKMFNIGDTITINK